MMIVFLFASVLTVVFAVGVVAFKHPIHSALCLVGNLLGVAMLFAALDAHFLAATQIIVYAGAIMVLVLFMLMLLNVKTERRTKRENLLTTVAVLSGFGFLVFVLPRVHEAFSGLPNHVALSNPGADPLQGTVEAMGIRLFTEYVFLFQASGVLLMTAIVGAVMLAKRSYGARSSGSQVVKGA